MMTDKQKERLYEKLIRLAYDLEYDAKRLREAGDQSRAATLQNVASTLGNLGRNGT
jgi:hypothetical protein